MNAKKLIVACQNAINKNEYRTCTIKGVRNLSRSDLETAIMYAEHTMRYGTWEGTLMPPRGEVAELLSRF